MLAFIDELFADSYGLVEIREIIGENDKRNRSRFFSSLDELKAYKAPPNKNVYIGMFTRNKRRGRAENSLTTGVLWCDYDNTTFQEVKERIAAVGVPEPSILVNSGHGVHAYWLLTERVGPEVLEVLKALTEQTGGDMRAAEVARVMRLPGTWNVKSTPVRCEVVERSGKRYSLHEIANVLKIDKRIPHVVQPVPELEKSQMACIRLIANGVKKGQRNFSLGRITNYLKLQGFTRKTAFETVKRWNLNNTPMKPAKELRDEFNRFWDSDYKYLGCTFSNPALEAINKQLCPMGECEHHAMQKIEVSNTENSIIMDNYFFKPTIYPKIEPIELAIYSIVAKTGEIERDKLAATLKRSKSTFLNQAIKHLASMGYIEIEERRHIKQRGKSDIIRLKDKSNYGRGFTLINPLLDDLFINNVVSGKEYKLMILLKRFAFGKNDVHPTLERLALTLGVTESYVSRMLKSLEGKLKIKRHSKKTESGREKLFIELIY